MILFGESKKDVPDLSTTGNSPVRVWQVIPSLTGGGAEKLVHTIHDRMYRDGIDTHLISFTKNINHNLHSRIISLGLTSTYNLGCVFRFCALLRQAAKERLVPNIIHTHLTPCQAFIPLAVRLAGIRVLLLTTEHSTFNRRRKMWLGRQLDKILYHPYTSIVCISEGTRESLCAWQPNLYDKLITIPNGIDINQYEWTTEIEYEAEPLIIISVGRLVPLKNYKVALRAIATLLNINQDIKIEYRIVGTGPEESALRKEISKLELDHCVKLMGWSKDVPSLLRQAQIFLLTSKWEGFGLVVAEAMASGLPVVVSDLPGVREVVGNNGECGFLIDPNNVELIAARLHQLVCDHQQRISMGMCGKQRVQRFSIDFTIQHYTKLYEKVLDDSSCFREKS